MEELDCPLCKSKHSFESIDDILPLTWINTLSTISDISYKQLTQDVTENHQIVLQDDTKVNNLSIYSKAGFYR